MRVQSYRYCKVVRISGNFPEMRKFRGFQELRWFTLRIFRDLNYSIGSGTVDNQCTAKFLVNYICKCVMVAKTVKFNPKRKFLTLQWTLGTCDNTIGHGDAELSFSSTASAVIQIDQSDR